MYLLSESTEMGPKKIKKRSKGKERSPQRCEVVPSKVPRSEYQQSSAAMCNHEFVIENGDDQPTHEVFQSPAAERSTCDVQNVCATDQPTSSGEDESQRYREQIKRRWKCLKKYTSPVELLNALCEKKLLSSKNFGNLNDMDISLAHDLVLTQSFFRIHNKKSFQTFTEAVASVCPDVDFEWENGMYSQMVVVHSDNQVGTKRVMTMYTRLEKNRNELQRLLKPQVVNDIKDEFFQQSIITIHEHEEIVNDILDNSSITKFIEILFAKIIEGSERCYNCLINCLQRIEGEKLYGSRIITSFLQGLEETPCETERVPRQTSSPISIKMIDGKLYTEIDEKMVAFMSRLKIYSENQEVTHHAIKDNADGMSASSVPVLSGYVDQTDIGCVVICFKALDDDLSFRLKRSLADGSFIELLENLFNEEAIRTSFSKGKYKLEVTIEKDRNCESRADKLGNGIAALLNMDHPKNMITANRSFLIRQLDTGIILKSFAERYGDHYQEFFKAGVGFGKERTKKAETLLSIIDRHKLEEDLLQILKDNKMTYIIKRLERCQQVYSHKKDVNMIRKNIIRKFRVLVEALDIEDMWETFAERGFNSKLFCELGEKFRDKRDQSTAAILIEILKSGCIAILTLIDCLFCNHMDSLANDLLNNSYSHVADDVDVGYPLLDLNKGTKKGLLFEGIFEIEVDTDRNDKMSDGIEKVKMPTDATFRSLEIKQEKLKDEQEVQDKTGHMNKEETKLFNYVIIEYGKEAVSTLFNCQLKRGQINFQKLISDYRHNLYHAVIPQRCCRCFRSQLRAHPRLFFIHGKLLFDTAKPKLPGHVQRSLEQSVFCCRPVNLYLTPEKLDLQLLVFLFMNCKELGKCPNDILEAVQTIRGSLNREKILNENYLDHESDIIKAILLICRYCETENEMKRKLLDVDKRPLDRSLITKYGTNLDTLEQAENIKIKNEVEERHSTSSESAKDKSKKEQPIDPNDTLQGIRSLNRRKLYSKSIRRKRIYSRYTSLKLLLRNLRKSGIYIQDKLVEYIQI